MFARVTVVEGPPDRIDEAIRIFRETVIPGAKTFKGFKGSYFLVDRKTGKQMGVALWETEADIIASTEAAGRLRAPFAKAATVQPRVEIYEVGAQA